MNFDLTRIPECIKHHAVFFQKHCHLIHTGRSLSTMLAAAYFSNEMLESVIIQATAIMADLIKDPIQTLARKQPSYYFFVKHIRHIALSIIQISDLVDQKSVFCREFGEHAKSISDPHLRMLQLQLMSLISQDSGDQVGNHGRHYWLYIRDATVSLRLYYECIRDFKQLKKDCQTDESFMAEISIIERVREAGSRWANSMGYHRLVRERLTSKRNCLMDYDHTDVVEEYLSPCSPYLNLALPEKIVHRGKLDASTDSTYQFLISMEL